MKPYIFIIDGKPVAKNGDKVAWKPFKKGDPRRKYYDKTGKLKYRDGFIHHYLDSEVKEYAQKVLWVLKSRHFKKLVTAIGVKIYIGIKPPDSVKGSKRKMTERNQFDEDESFLLMPTTKPDVDNTIKNLLDAIKNDLFVDDSYICSLKIDKRFASSDFVSIEVKPIGLPIQWSVGQIKEYMDKIRGIK